jgi:GNAT superfamily N-acetyltransferase
MDISYESIVNDAEGRALQKLRRTYHELSPAFFINMCRAGPDYFVSALNVPWARAVLAYTRGTLSGFCFTAEPKAVANRVFIEILYVGAAAKGDGAPLLAESERNAMTDPRVQGRRHAFQVQSANDVATRFYERNGYKMWNRDSNILLKIC